MFPSTAVTVGTGEAQTDFTLGTLPGDDVHWVTVTVNSYPGVTPLDVIADGTPDLPDTVTLVSGNNQMDGVGHTLNEPLVVYSEDQYGNVAQGHNVDWTSGDGTFSLPTTVIDAGGYSSTQAILGPVEGGQQFTATANGHSVVFDATAEEHWIERIEPWKVWPGYPDPEAADPCASFDFEVDYIIPDTGQTQCYDASNNAVICSSIPLIDPMYGQDGHYLQSTYGQHFYTDNGDGTVNDDVTGLMWQQCPAGLSGAGCATGSVATYNWYEATGTADATYNPGGAVDYCGDLSTGGYTDWRLPDYHELLGIVDYGQYDPSIDTAVFPGTPSSHFCSSSSFVLHPNYAWRVFFITGHVWKNFDKANYDNVRCVRGGP